MGDGGPICVRGVGKMGGDGAPPDVEMGAHSLGEGAGVDGITGGAVGASGADAGGGGGGSASIGASWLCMSWISLVLESANQS